MRATVVLAVLVTPVLGAAGLAALSSPGPVWGTVSAVSAVVIPLVALCSVWRRRPDSITAADRVTLLRVALIGVLSAALVLAAAGVLPPRSWVVLIVAALAALLDAVDGWVARRFGSATAAGARLDGESDAAALLVLSALLAMTVGWWVVLIGLMRYLFAAASVLRPPWRQPLEYSAFRRGVAGYQACAMVVGLTPVVPVVVATAIGASALAALLVSFGRDVRTLERSAASSQRRRAPR